MSSNFWLTEEQFSKINPLLPNKPRGVPRVDDRRVLSGIIFCLQRGYRWSDVPAEYGPARTLYNRYKRWSEPGIFGAGVFERVFERLAREHADRRVLLRRGTPHALVCPCPFSFVTRYVVKGAAQSRYRSTPPNGTGPISASASGSAIAIVACASTR